MKIRKTRDVFTVKIKKVCSCFMERKKGKIKEVLTIKIKEVRSCFIDTNYEILGRFLR